MASDNVMVTCESKAELYALIGKFKPIGKGDAKRVYKVQELNSCDPNTNSFELKQREIDRSVVNDTDNEGFFESDAAVFEFSVIFEYADKEEKEWLADKLGVEAKRMRRRYKAKELF